jgi:hypothetical protein
MEDFRILAFWPLSPKLNVQKAVKFKELEEAENFLENKKTSQKAPLSQQENQPFQP